MSDPVIDYIEEEKRQLRQLFRDKKAHLEELHAKVAVAEKELNGVKDRLSFTDEMVNRRLRESGQKLEAASPSLPFLGRFSQLGPTQAIRALFDTDPDQELSAPQIADLLIKEGFQTESPNLSGIIFTICKQRLEREDGYLESFMRNNLRYFKKK